MRLPFGFGRRSSPGDGATGGGANAGSGPAIDSDAHDAAGARGAAAGSPNRAWASLPPIQRATGEMPLVAAPAAFAEELPGSHGLPPIVQPLGHEVSSLATPGLVVARVRPVEASIAGSIPAPVQRRVPRGTSSAGIVPAPAPIDIAGDSMEHVEGPSAASRDVAAAAAIAPAPPIRSMPTVSRLTVRMPELPLTNAAAAARPASAQRADAAAAGLALPPASPGGMRRVPAPTSQPAPIVSRQAASPQAGPATPSATASPASSREPTRHGLGEPVPTVPPSARPVGAGAPPAVSRSTISRSMPVAASSPRPATQASDGPAPRPEQLPALAPGSPASPPVPVPATTLAALPHLPVARSTTAAIAATPVGTAAAPASRAAEAPPTRELRPIASANPLRSSIAIQRAPAGVDDVEAPEDALPSPWWIDSPAASRSSVDGLANLDAAASPAQRSTSGARGLPAHGASSGREPSLDAPFGSTLAAPAVQRATGQGRASLPPVRGAAPDLGARATAAASRPAADDSGFATPSIASRSLGEIVVQTSPAAAGPGADAAQRHATPPFGQPPSVQRAEAGGQMQTSAVADQPSAARSERDLDELAQALFGRIRGRIRSDLIHDREAKGLTFDNV